MSGAMEIMGATFEPLLSRGMSCSVSARNSGPGQITITYPTNVTRADQLGPDMLVHVRASSGTQSALLAPYKLKDFRIDPADSDRPEMGVWQGVQHGWYVLERSLTHSNYFPGGIKPTVRLNGNAGTIMDFNILNDARARGVLTRLSITGDFTNDAKGDDWLEETFAPDLTPWDRTAAQILTVISEEDPVCEWDMVAHPTLEDDETDPNLLTWLRLYNPGSMGIDQTSVDPGDRPLEISTGLGVTAAPQTQSVGPGPLHRILAYNKSGDHVIVETEDIGDADEIHEIGRSFPEASEGELTRRATRLLTKLRRVETEQSLDLDLSGRGDLPVPGVDVNLGDWLYIGLGGTAPVRRRLAEWSITLHDDGKVSAGLVMDSVLRTHSQRFDRTLIENVRQINLLTSGEYE